MEIVAATTPFLVDGRAVGISPGGAHALPRGSTLDTGRAVVRIRTSAEDEVRLSPGTTLRSDGTVDGVEYLFLLSGEAEGRIGERTALGTAEGWVSPPAGAFAEVRVRTRGPAASLLGGGTLLSSSFESVSGPVWIRCAAADVRLPPASRALLDLDGSGGGPLGFRSAVGPGPPFQVISGRGTPSETSAEVSVGFSGSVERSTRTGETRWRCAQAPDGGRLRVDLRANPAARPCAALAPGTACVVDGRGRVRVEVEGVPPVTLERLLTLEAEFDAR